MGCGESWFDGRGRLLGGEVVGGFQGGGGSGRGGVDGRVGKGARVEGFGGEGGWLWGEVRFGCYCCCCCGFGALFGVGKGVDGVNVFFVGGFEVGADGGEAYLVGEDFSGPGQLENLPLSFSPPRA